MRILRAAADILAGGTRLVARMSRTNGSDIPSVIVRRPRPPPFSIHLFFTDFTTLDSGGLIGLRVIDTNHGRLLHRDLAVHTRLPGAALHCAQSGNKIGSITIISRRY